MKNRVRVILLLSCLLLLMIASGCGLSSKGLTFGHMADNLSHSHLLMFDATVCNLNLRYEGVDSWVATHFSVYYDGTVEGCLEYNVSGKLGEFTAQLSPEDYELLYNFLADGFIQGKYDTEIKADDGSGWYFACFDEYGTILHEFHGYTYDLEEYEKIQSMLYSYQPAFSEPPQNPEGVTEP